MAQRSPRRQPVQSFDNATYVISGDQLISGQQNSYSNHPHEQSQGFDFASTSGDSGTSNSTGRGVSCNACISTSGDGSDGSDSVRRPKRRTNRAYRRARSLSAKRHERRVSWATCAPVVMMTLMMSLILLVSLAAMPRSNSAAAAVSSANHPTAKQHAPKIVLFLPTRTTVNSPALPVSSSLPSPRSERRLATPPNLTSRGGDDNGTERPKMTAKVEIHDVTSRDRRARHGTLTKRRVGPKQAANGYEKVDHVEGGNDFMALKFRRPARPMCGDVFYTVCHPSGEREFHYRRSVNACVETAADVVHSCNRGVNRFASLGHCRQSCMRESRPPAKECLGKPLLTSCARQDVLSSWWFFEGRKCLPWNFPSGGCPANDSTVFSTAEECWSHCLRGGRRGSLCHPPRAVPCGVRHLKYPFFADVSVTDGRIRCLRSSPDVLQHRRCLIGANKFRTRQACMSACKNWPRG
ncbi:hypothetical protein HPB50_002434 [Hyalomma asiaticum]|uniref:Uncharacterized protein n=1 Tax=Hyalomma asiaticum TaxID=266040 RepID=A0ACB7SBQ6_HYAAI|nr:hypothetical protein HPB50_002434 [Hyalomma asiaticum]